MSRILVLLAFGILLASELPLHAATEIEALVARLDRIEAENKALRTRLANLENGRSRVRDLQSSKTNQSTYATISRSSNLATNQPRPATRTWTGFYVGGQIGAGVLDSGWSNAQVGPNTLTSPFNAQDTIIPPFRLSSDHSVLGTGGLAGLQVG